MSNLGRQPEVAKQAPLARGGGCPASRKPASSFPGHQPPVRLRRSPPLSPLPYLPWSLYRDAGEVSASPARARSVLNAQPRGGLCPGPRARRSSGPRAQQGSARRPGVVSGPPAWSGGDWPLSPIPYIRPPHLLPTVWTSLPRSPGAHSSPLPRHHAQPERGQVPAAPLRTAPGGSSVIPRRAPGSALQSRGPAAGPQGAFPAQYHTRDFLPLGNRDHTFWIFGENSQHQKFSPLVSVALFSSLTGLLIVPGPVGSDDHRGRKGQQGAHAEHTPGSTLHQAYDRSLPAHPHKCPMR